MAGAHAARSPRHRIAEPEKAPPAPADPANVPIDSLLTTEAIPIVGGKGRRRATPAPTYRRRGSVLAMASVTGTIMMIQLGLPTTGETSQVATAHTPAQDDAEPITAPNDIVLARDKVQIKTAPYVPEPTPEPVLPAVVSIAPVPPAPAPVAPPAQAPRVQAPAVVPPPPVQAPVVQAPAPAPVAAPAPAPGGKAAQIAASAIAQARAGIGQDCTMLVTNALATVGIRFHDWPVGYHSLGHTVSAAEAIPGDLIYYAQHGSSVPHIAVYIGNGRAIHGGWNGNQTIEWSVNVGWPAYPPTSYIRVH
jgi:cell wall-associated NlpC family hydrolase